MCHLCPGYLHAASCFAKGRTGKSLELSNNYRPLCWLWCDDDDICSLGMVQKRPGAMIPSRAVMRRTVVFTCLFAFCHMGSLSLAPYYLPEWFQVVEGVSPLQSGIRMLPTVITQILSTMTASRLGKHTTPCYRCCQTTARCTVSRQLTCVSSFKTPILQDLVHSGANIHVYL